MAEARKSAKLTAARQLAREKSAQFREREDELESLAVDYFTYIEQIDEANELAEREIGRIRAQADLNITDRRTSAARTVDAMLAQGASRAEVAGRLGISTRDVKRPSVVPAAPAKSVGKEIRPGEEAAALEITPVGQ
ncbi:hypothetical protein C3B59_05895 [Cryobacterium zongtaii]|uniref:Uncharacterized protein n=1 Tax=Cryobacterium zongtaii TaxID=1259217 RepID=A0A2S3ZLF8_9MICO|nr:hypothetical protein [Cryobacterium zongtaii]POH69169.1 hypothetical protein C3B59_05895 [Cryobacterium zongtaii]